MSFFMNALSKSKETPFDALVDVLKEQKVERGRVGIEFSNLSKETLDGLKKKLPNLELRDCTELIRFIRMVKTQEEVRRLRQAAEINEKALLRSLSLARDGIRIGELRQKFLVETAKEGATFDHYIYSPKGLGISGAEMGTLRAGDCTLIDVGCQYRSYYADTGTTLVIGRRAADEAVKLQKTMVSVVDEVSDTLRQGGTPSLVMKALAKACSREKITNVLYQGHGIGLEPREHPVIAATEHKRIEDDIISESVEIPFEGGMIINIETPTFTFSDPIQ